VEILLAWEFVQKGGSWFSLSEDLKSFSAENGFSVFPEGKEKIQGIATLYNFLENSPDTVSNLLSFARERIFRRK
jgi:hypothetical protein